MRYSLRKGSTTAYFQFPFHNDTLHIADSGVQWSNGMVVIDIAIQPVGENQRLDEEHLHEEKLISLQVDDHYTLSRLGAYLSSRSPTTSSVQLKIFSKWRSFFFDVALSNPSPGCLLITVIA